MTREIVHVIWLNSRNEKREKEKQRERARIESATSQWRTDIVVRRQLRMSSRVSECTECACR
jgi:hypothetical protein